MQAQLGFSYSFDAVHGHNEELLARKEETLQSQVQCKGGEEGRQ